MKKIDLIIDALKLACHETYGLAASDCYSQALAAARELRALKPVGVFEYDAENNVWEELTPNTEGVKLYALDDARAAIAKAEVKHD